MAGGLFVFSKGEKQMITKTIKIDGKDIKFANSAAIPRLYRLMFKEDIIIAMSTMKKQIEESEGNLPIESLTLFENIAYTMAKHADKTIPDTIDEWLDGFNSFNIYEILPEIMELWADGMEQKSTPKKANEQ